MSSSTSYFMQQSVKPNKKKTFQIFSKANTFGFNLRPDFGPSIMKVIILALALVGSFTVVS